MQRYLRPSLLQNAGLQTFDDWASNFGEVVSKAELKPAGNGYRTKKRFAKFNNVPELMQMFKEFSDIRTPDMLNLPVPELEGGKPQTIEARPNDEQKANMQQIYTRLHSSFFRAITFVSSQFSISTDCFLSSGKIGLRHENHSVFSVS